MRDELEQIKARLEMAGWTLSVPAKEDEMARYVKSYGSNNGPKDVVGIEVCVDPCSLGVYGRYGVCSVQLVKFGQPMPYLRDDLKAMMSLIKDAERELLLNARVPFRPSYLFIDCTEMLLCENYDLRQEFNLDQLEKEDFGE